MVVNTAEPGSGCWGSDGTGSWLVTVDGDVPQSSGSLAPVPRGSKLTRSNRWRTTVGNEASTTGRIWIPLSPGPPGLNTRVPIRLAGSSAGARDTASLGVAGLGWE